MAVELVAQVNVRDVHFEHLPCKTAGSAPGGQPVPPERQPGAMHFGSPAHESPRRDFHNGSVHVRLNTPEHLNALTP